MEDQYPIKRGVIPLSVAPVLCSLPPIDRLLEAAGTVNLV